MVEKMTQIEALIESQKVHKESLTQKDAQRIERLQKYVSRVEEAQKVMLKAINEGKFEAFSEEDIRFHLSHDPDMIAEAGLFLAKIQRAYEYAKTDSQIIMAELWRQCNDKKDALGLSSAKDRDSWVKTQPKYIEAVHQELEWKYRFNQMQVIYDRYENLYVGSRKLASLIEKDNQNVYRREKYDESSR